MEEFNILTCIFCEAKVVSPLVPYYTIFSQAYIFVGGSSTHHRDESINTRCLTLWVKGEGVCLSTYRYNHIPLLIAAQ